MDSTNLKQIDGGNIIVSGDVSSVFSYQLQDENYKSLTLDGTAIVTLILKTDRNPYMRKEVNMIDGVVSFVLPILKSGSYQVSIEAGGYLFPSSGNTHILIEPNPGDGILETVGPLTIEDYIAPLIDGLATEVYVQDALAGVTAPNLDDYAKKVDVPTTVGLATETYVDNHIADSIGAIAVPNLSGLATETYVNNQIAAIPLPEPIDTSVFITKPLTYPILPTDPTSKDYVDDAVAGLTGGGTTEGGTWTIIASGEHESFEYNAYNNMVDNGYKKFRVMMSVNSDADLFELHFRHGNGSSQIISEAFNKVTEGSSADFTVDGGVTSRGGRALVILDYELIDVPYLDTGSDNAMLTVSIYSNEFALLSAVSGSVPSYNYLPNFKRLVGLNNTQTGNATLNVNNFTGFLFKTVKGVFLGYK